MLPVVVTVEVSPVAVVVWGVDWDMVVRFLVLGFEVDMVVVVVVVVLCGVVGLDV